MGESEFKQVPEKQNLHYISRLRVVEHWTSKKPTPIPKII